MFCCPKGMSMTLVREGGTPYAYGVERHRVEAGWRLTWGVVGGVVLVTSLVSFFFARSYQAVLGEAFRERSVAYASAFADAVQVWLAGGEADAARGTARLLLLGSAFYVQVVTRGQVLLDERVERADSLDLSPLWEPPSARTARFARMRGGEAYLDIIVPSGVAAAGTSGGTTYVRVGIDSSSVAVRGRGMVLLVSGMGALVDLLVAGTFLFLARRPLARREEIPAQPSEEPGPPGKVAEWGGLRVEEATKRVSFLGEAVSLTPKQYSLLYLLASEPGRVFSDREIVAAIWPESPYADSKDVKQQIYLLRRRLARVHPDGARLIANAPGFGYHLASQSVDKDMTGP